MLLGFLFILSFFLFSLIILDHMMLKTNMEKAKDAIDAALLAGLERVNQEALSYNVIEFDKAAVQATFTSYLQDNMAGIAAAPPVIEEFAVYNPEDLPATCSRGCMVNEPSVHLVMRVVLNRPVLGGLFGEKYRFRVHLDFGNALE